MVDAGFGKTIDRDSDALRWALGTPDVVASSADWVAAPVTGQRAVTISAGQGQAAQVTMPGGSGAKTSPVTLSLPFNGSMTFKGKLICRELEWYDIDSVTPGESRFVVLDGPDSSSVPVQPPSFSAVSGFTRQPGVKYHMPLWYAVVDQSSNSVRLFDLRKVSPLDKPARVPGELIGVYNAPWDNYTGNFAFAGPQGRSAFITDFTIPDPGVPYRAEVVGNLEGGPAASGTRVDFNIGFGGTGNEVVTNSLAPVLFINEFEVRFKSFASTLSEVLSGARTWRVTANRVSGSADGYIGSARRLQVRYYYAG